MTDTWDLLLAGLPESGKSTYLGALFHTLKLHAVDGLQLEGMPEERDYLIELEQDWLSLKPLEHSGHHGPKRIELPIRDHAHDRPMNIIVPDIVGEEYENAWELGRWNDDVLSCIVAARGILLFIRADDVRTPNLIDVRGSVGEGIAEPLPWRPEYAPTQAKLCDLLEQVSEIRSGAIPPLAVVVSAWDTVSSMGLTPAAWLAWQAPLLDQWLQGQSPEMIYAVFGVSAQGGDVRRQEVRESLARNADSRPIPEGADTLTGPLRWLLDRIHTNS